MLRVRANHKNLHDHLKHTFHLERAGDFARRPQDCADTVEKGHGRSEIRHDRVVNNPDLLTHVDFDQDRRDRTRLVRVESERRGGDQVATDIRVCISRLPCLGVLRRHGGEADCGMGHGPPNRTGPPGTARDAQARRKRFRTPERSDRRGPGPTPGTTERTGCREDAGGNRVISYGVRQSARVELDAVNFSRGWTGVEQSSGRGVPEPSRHPVGWGRGRPQPGSSRNDNRPRSECDPTHVRLRSELGLKPPAPRQDSPGGRWDRGACL